MYDLLHVGNKRRREAEQKKTKKKTQMVLNIWDETEMEELVKPQISGMK